MTLPASALQRAAHRPGRRRGDGVGAALYGSAARGTLVGLQVVRRHDGGRDEDEPVPDGGSPGTTVSLTLSGGGVSLGVGPGW